MIRRWLGMLAILVGLSGISPPTAAFAAPGPNNPHNKWCTVGHNPWCAAPEAPLPIGLPLAGLVVVGGFAVMARRRRSVPDRC
jgi:hypothetical protein